MFVQYASRTGFGSAPTMSSWKNITPNRTVMGTNMSSIGARFERSMRVTAAGRVRSAPHSVHTDGRLPMQMCLHAVHRGRPARQSGPIATMNGLIRSHGRATGTMPLTAVLGAKAISTGSTHSTTTAVTTALGTAARRRSTSVEFGSCCTASARSRARWSTPIARHTSGRRGAAARSARSAFARSPSATAGRASQ
jgi:hypothetical protein